MQLIPPDINIQFIGNRKKFYVFSGLIVTVAIASLIGRKLTSDHELNYGIDFTGGSDIHLKFKESVASDDLRAAIKTMGFANPEVQRFGDAEDNEYMVRIREKVTVLDDAGAASIEKAIKDDEATFGKLKKFSFAADAGDRLYLWLGQKLDEKALLALLERHGLKSSTIEARGNPEDHRYQVQLQELQSRLSDEMAGKFGKKFDKIIRAEIVGPKVGEQLRNDGILSMLVALIAILFYIAVRFDFRYAPGAVACLVHDVLIVVGLFSLLWRQFSLPTIAALLTVIGYSLNDTIVVFDRIRENVGYAREKSLDKVINKSINETLSRTLLTSVTTLLVVMALLIFGGGLIQDFALALLMGVLIGTYSSIAVASPMVLIMDGLIPKLQARFFPKTRRSR